MDTNDLIKALTADTRPNRASLPAVWWMAVALAVAIAATVFVATIGPRPDFAGAIGTVRFPFKFVVTVTLAISAFGAVRALSRPGESWRSAAVYLVAAPLLLAFAVAAELFALPSYVWLATAVGSNSLVCLAYIPLIGAGPLAVFVAVLRHGAPTRPELAGAAAGLLAGGIAATFYAAHCTDDSPFFVAIWYTTAVSILALAGAVAARYLTRW
jgi:hypothetical protein